MTRRAARKGIGTCLRGNSTLLHIGSVARRIALVGLMMAGIPRAGFAFVGVQTNVPVASLTAWTLCYSDTYANGSTSLATILAACNGPNLLMGCRPVGSPDLTIAAHAPRTDVIFDTGTGNTPHDANGVGWYYNDNWSWGFAPQGDPINRFSCDVDFTTDSGLRLCWHTGGSFINTGYRCGSTTLNGDGSWERLVFQSSLSCGDGVIDAGEDCDDGNLFSGDGCSSACQIEPCYGCSGAPSTCAVLPDGSACDDGTFCNGADTCSAGACMVHVGDPCTGGECNTTCNETTDSCADPIYTPCTADTEDCTDDYCDGSGACIHPPSYYTYCDDGLYCNGSDLCYGGTCSYHYSAPCDYVECNGVCDEPTDTCTPSPPGSFCYDEGNICTTDECDGAGTCVHPPTPSGSFCYDEGNVCTNEECDGMGTCVHPPGPSGVPCPDDLLECTDDLCDGAGTCGHPPRSNTTPCTSDGNECSDDHCDGAGGCAHSPVTDGTTCDDSNACTQTDECEMGACVGSDPIVCPVLLCRGAETCDPGSGACSTCPAGYSPGGGGCQKTYAIDVSLLDNQGSYCDGTGANRYEGCTATAFGFHWADTGDAAVGDVIGVDVRLEAGIDCDPTDHSVTLNSTPIGTYPSTNDCNCIPIHQSHLLADVDISTYVKGGANSVSINAFYCAGLSQDADGAYAVVTVTYEDPGLPYAIQSGCRAATKSQLKYKNSADDGKDKINWKWGKGVGTTGAEFGDPTDAADYRLCVFGEAAGDPTLLFSAEVPASATLWSASGSKGFKYGDAAGSASGVSKLLLKGGADGKPKIILKGKGAGLSDPTLPLAMGTTGVRVQLTNQSNGLCWESEFPIGSVTSTEATLKAKAP